nr:hypothetical protein BaRGS_007252 [Batillaria attramentaria]
MGNNIVTLRNLSGKKLLCLTFNSSDHVQWAYRDRVRVPVNGEGVEVDGLQGGGGVKVGVVFDKEDGYLYIDLYWVAHGATLTISRYELLCCEKKR